MYEIKTLVETRHTYQIETYIWGVGSVTMVEEAYCLGGRPSEIWILLKPFCDAFGLQTKQVVQKLPKDQKHKIKACYKGKTRLMWAVNKEVMLNLLPIFERTRVMTHWHFRTMEAHVLMLLRDHPISNDSALCCKWGSTPSQEPDCGQNLSDRGDDLEKLAGLYLRASGEVERLRRVLAKTRCTHELYS